jgi:hypothetical protein
MVMPDNEKQKIKHTKEISLPQGLNTARRGKDVYCEPVFDPKRGRPFGDGRFIEIQGEFYQNSL